GRQRGHASSSKPDVVRIGNDQVLHRATSLNLMEISDRHCFFILEIMEAQLASGGGNSRPRSAPHPRDPPGGPPVICDGTYLKDFLYGPIRQAAFQVGCILRPAMIDQ